jgi:phage-related protein
MFRWRQTATSTTDCDRFWEVRSHVSTGIARVMFTVDGQAMVLLHGFQKKS